MACKTSCVLLVLYSCILWTIIHGGPVRDKVTIRDQVTAVNYLTRLGYLSLPDTRAGHLRTNEELSEGIKTFQLYAGIPVTGVVDEKTMWMMALPRCGMPDFGRSDRTKRKRRYAVQGTVWRKKELTYMIEGGPSNAISESEVEKQVGKAFKEWERISRLKFFNSTDPNSDILVRFQSGMHNDGFPFDGASGSLAHGFYPHNNEGLSGDIHFDDDETWILSKDKKGTDFYWTALHEIGHALGLDHSNYKDAVMYPFYTGFKENLRLNEDDVQGIHYLYGMPSIKVETEAPEAVPTKTNLLSGVPHACTVPSFDAVFADANKITFFFSGRYFWIVPESGKREGALAIKQNWPKLPAEGIDAAYQSEGKTTFFKGKNCWVYKGTRYLSGPVAISKQFKNLGSSVASIDAAFVWGANGKTYLFSGDHYWRYNEAFDMIDMGYPAKINDSWLGVPNNLDSAMTWFNGRTYFFKGNGFWIFENFDIRTTHTEPMMTNAYWMKCLYGKREDPTTPPTIDPSLKCSDPSPCKTSFDAVVHSSDGNTYFFKKPYFWTLDKYNRSLGGKRIVDHWPGLHPRVQAAYTRRDGKTVFFKGRKYWVFEGKTRIEGPKNISEYGLPLTLKRLDAAFTWNGNGKTYFFKGDKYWRYNEQMKTIDPGYPKNISAAVRYPVDAVMTWSDGNTYFFSGRNFSKYEFRKWHLYRFQSSEFFFKCQECEDDEKVEVAVKETDVNAEEKDDNGVLKTTVFAPLILLLASFSSLFNY